MNRLKRYVDALEEILFRAHRAAESMTASEDWQRLVMNDVRRLGSLEPENGALVAYNRLAWRFLAAACAAALVLLVFAYTNGFVDHRELAVTLLQDPLAGYLP